MALISREDKNVNINGDTRAVQIWTWLKGNPTPDAMRCVCYALQKLEASGDLEIFITEEIDRLLATSAPPQIVTKRSEP